MTKKTVPTELLLAQEQTSREMWVETLSGARQVGVVLVNSPTFQLIAGLVAVELLQKIKIDNKPLVSDMLANTMTGVIAAKGATSAVEGIFSLINPFD